LPHELLIEHYGKKYYNNMSTTSDLQYRYIPGMIKECMAKDPEFPPQSFIRDLTRNFVSIFLQ